VYGVKVAQLLSYTGIAAGNPVSETTASTAMGTVKRSAYARTCDDMNPRSPRVVITGDADEDPLQNEPAKRTARTERKTSGSAKPKVAVLYPVSVPWFAQCVDGIRQYAHGAGGWLFFCSPPTLSGAGESALTLRSMRDWNGDAMIVVSNDERELRAVRRMGIPVVNLGGGLAKSYGVPRVMVNHYQAGRLAADHLLSRGLAHLAFFGWSNLWYSQQRRFGFRSRAAESGVTCSDFLRASYGRANLSWAERVAEVSKWLRSLLLPVGIFAVQDYRAQFLMEACQEAGLRIPEDVAVIGMDNDTTICEHTEPTLTSIARNSERVGWAAAELLDRMMHGEPPPAEDLLVEPEGIALRQSTERLYCADPVVQRALDYMRENLKAQFKIEAIAEHAAVSKRTLETRFREKLRCSPHEFLTKLRVERAQVLMQMSPKRTIEQTAKECGFGTVPAFHAAFRRLTGQSPGRFRKKHLAKGQTP
jgi:LacI family transcriptional regulator